MPWLLNLSNSLFMIAVRIALPEEASMIAEISRETFKETFAAVNSASNMDKFLAEQFTREQLMSEVGVPGNIFLLAEWDNLIAGYAFLKEAYHGEMDPNTSLEISRIYVRSPFIRKGVGRALMESIIQRATTLGKNCLWLGVWEHNPKAIEFYSRFGFEKFAEKDFLLGDDLQHDWVMKRVVGS